MQTLQWIVNDFASLGPSFGYASRVQSVPKIGDTAPATPLTLTASKADIIIFTRHLGCPYCEKEIRRLVKLAQSPENADVNFNIVTHSVSTGDLEQFVTKELDLSLPTNVKCYGDPQRDVYAAYGLGEIGITSVINRNVLSQLGELKKEGITNRLTRGTRWQTNGGFAIDKNGKIQYAHVGEDSADVTDLDKALASVRS